MQKTVVPYKNSVQSKKKQVADMFDNIAHRYDFLNHLLSLGIDRYWRWYGIKLLRPIRPLQILDVATGTGDFAFAALTLQPEHVTGVDISEGMLALGRKKIEQRNMQHKMTFLSGDAENLPFADESFDAITVAFGVRNFENLNSGLCELQRVLKKGGRLVVLEFAKPQIFPVKQLYNAYFRYILPLIGRFFSRDESAYTYLPESVQAFPERQNFLTLLTQNGFAQSQCYPLTLGICAAYTADK